MLCWNTVSASYHSLFSLSFSPSLSSLFPFRLIFLYVFYRQVDVFALTMPPEEEVQEEANRRSDISIWVTSWSKGW